FAERAHEIAAAITVGVTRFGELRRRRAVIASARRNDTDQSNDRTEDKATLEHNLASYTPRLLSVKTRDRGTSHSSHATYIERPRSPSCVVGQSPSEFGGISRLDL